MLNSALSKKISYILSLLVAVATLMPTLSFVFLTASNKFEAPYHLFATICIMLPISLIFHAFIRGVINSLIGTNDRKIKEIQITAIVAFCLILKKEYTLEKHVKFARKTYIVSTELPSELARQQLVFFFLLIIHCEDINISRKTRKAIQIQWTQLLDKEISYEDAKELWDADKAACALLYNDNVSLINKVHKLLLEFNDQIEIEDIVKRLKLSN